MGLSTHYPGKSWRTETRQIIGTEAVLQPSLMYIKKLKAYLSAVLVCTFAHTIYRLLLCIYFVPDITRGNIAAGTYCKANCLQVLNHFIWSVIISCNWCQQMIIFLIKYISILLDALPDAYTYKELLIFIYI